MKKYILKLVRYWNFGLFYQICIIGWGLIFISISFALSDYVLGTSQTVYIKVTEKHFIEKSIPQYILVGYIKKDVPFKWKVNENEFHQISIDDRYRYNFRQGKFTNKHY